MKDLVETVIGQVMRQDPASVSAQRRMPAPGHDVRHLNAAGRAMHDPAKANDPLWQASRQFESLFVEQMLASMRKTVPDSGLLKKGFAEGVSTTMMDQAVADAIGKQGRMGIATSLYRQLSSDYAKAAPTHDSVETIHAKATPIHENAETGDKQVTGLPAMGGRTEGE